MHDCLFHWTLFFHHIFYYSCASFFSCTNFIPSTCYWLCCWASQLLRSCNVYTRVWSNRQHTPVERVTSTLYHYIDNQKGFLSRPQSEWPCLHSTSTPTSFFLLLYFNKGWDINLYLHCKSWYLHTLSLHIYQCKVSPIPFVSTWEISQLITPPKKRRSYCEYCKQ